MMSYFKNRMNILRDEYKESDRREVIAAAGGKCPLCDRKPGDEFTFGPTRYLKKRILFKVTMHIHAIEGAIVGGNKMVMCSGCHMSYHHFNRLTEEAELGGKKLSNVVYKRCHRCNDLFSYDDDGNRSCICCKKCNRAPKWCVCVKRKKAAKKKKTKITRKKSSSKKVKKKVSRTKSK